ncbi:MAG TPA: hypothetical protein PLH27_02410 [bacterium]|nr:hypothetical protein [bacterium]HMW33902.1 hypothetical protein [bacterium]HMW36658.1 hypothetical protein [bacterium]HMY37233.1 hypothetical protein [bacterium]HMZ03281.1 hypothetical protein [bacterium]
MRLVITLFIMLLPVSPRVWAHGLELECFYKQNGTRVFPANYTIQIKPAANTTIYGWDNNFAAIPQGDPAYYMFEANHIKADFIYPDGLANSHNYTTYYGLYEVTFLEIVNDEKIPRGTVYFDNRDANYHGLSSSPYPTRDFYITYDLNSGYAQVSTREGIGTPCDLIVDGQPVNNNGTSIIYTTWCFFGIVPNQTPFKNFALDVTGNNTNDVYSIKVGSLSCGRTGNTSLIEGLGFLAPNTRTVELPYRIAQVDADGEPTGGTYAYFRSWDDGVGYAPQSPLDQASGKT